MSTLDEYFGLQLEYLEGLLLCPLFEGRGPNLLLLYTVDRLGV